MRTVSSGDRRATQEVHLMTGKPLGLTRPSSTRKTADMEPSPRSERTDERSVEQMARMVHDIIEELRENDLKKTKIVTGRRGARNHSGMSGPNR
jgi:hypothetical protein